MGGFAISTALKGLFKTEAGGLDGLSDIYSFNVRRNKIQRLDDPSTVGGDPTLMQQPNLQIHPWHFVSRSMTPQKIVSFNYDTNDIIEVTLPKYSPPTAAITVNLESTM